MFLHGLVLLSTYFTINTLAHPFNPSSISTGRFSIPIHNHQDQTELYKRSTGSASSHVSSRFNAWSTISIGGQKVSVILDTGSSNFWVYTTTAARKSFTHGTGGSSLYSPSENRHTFETLSNVSFAVSYGTDGKTGSFSGSVGSDLVTVGTTKSIRQAIGLQPFTLKTKDLSNLPSQGVFGLGLGGNGNFMQPKQKTWLDSIVPTLDKPLFTVTVGEDGSGKWNFGYIDETQHKGDITYVPLDTRPSCSGTGFWTIPKLAVAWTGLNGSYGEPGCVIVDSGANEISLNPYTVREYYKHIPGSKAIDHGYYTIPCSANPPDFIFGFAKLGAKDFLGTATFEGGLMKVGIVDAGKGVCLGTLTENNNGISILGQAFMKAQFVVFDVGGRRMGFADAASQGGKTATS